MKARLLADLIDESADRSEQAAALWEGGRSVTYGELAHKRDSLAGFLVENGLRKGDRVAIVLQNSIDFVVSHLAVMKAGGISVPLPIEISARQVNFFQMDTGCRYWITADRVADIVADQRDGKVALVIRDGSPSGATSPTIDEAIAIGTWRGPAGRFIEIDLATLLYTTGTSGNPKAVMLTHHNIISAIRNIIAFVGHDHEREVVVLPINHSYGLGQVYCNLATGGTVFLEAGLLRMGAVLEVMTREKITAFACPPAGYQVILDRFAPRFQEAGKFLRHSIVNSAPMPPELTKKILDLLPQLQLIVYYGLTEASRSTFINLTREDPSNYRSVGRPAPHVDVQILDEGGCSLEKGQLGEVTIRGNTVASGYWRRPEETACAFRSGVLHTGDLGSLDSEGNLWLQGRLKDIVNVGGLKVSPGEVEAIILEHPSVADCAVAGTEDEITGEGLGVIVVVRAGYQWSPTTLVEHVSSNLEWHKVPRTWIQVAEVPKVTNGKPSRREVARIIRESTKKESP